MNTGEVIEPDTGNPGTITVTTKYLTDAILASTDVAASFNNRSLVIIAF